MFAVSEESSGLLSPNSYTGRCRSTPNSLIHYILRPLRSACLLNICFGIVRQTTAFLHPFLLSLSLRSKDGQPRFDVLFGPAYKGISLGAVVSSALYNDFGVDVGFAYNRKEAKDHGEGGTLVGAPMNGKRVLIVDDVITAGTAIREAHGMLTSIGAKPVGVVIALDRDEVRALDDKVSAVQAASRDLSIDAVSIVKLGELQAFLERSSDYDQATLQSVIDYRKQYGAS